MTINRGRKKKLIPCPLSNQKVLHTNHTATISELTYQWAYKSDLKGVWSVLDHAGPMSPDLHLPADRFGVGRYTFRVTASKKAQTSSSTVKVTFVEDSGPNLLVTHFRETTFNDKRHNPHEELRLVGQSTDPTASYEWMMVFGNLDVTPSSSVRRESVLQSLVLTLTLTLTLIGGENQSHRI